ncbi:hypothetical protein [Pseudomonas putida]|nr:hypothetical protein [Pseudomonas putida]
MPYSTLPCSLSTPRTRLAERAGFVIAGSRLTELDPSTPCPLYRRSPA